MSFMFSVFWESMKVIDVAKEKMLGANVRPQCRIVPLRRQPLCVSNLLRPLGRKINFTNSKTLVGWWMSRQTVTRVTSNLPECKEP